MFVTAGQPGAKISCANEPPDTGISRRPNFHSDERVNSGNKLGGGLGGVKPSDSIPFDVLTPPSEIGSLDFDWVEIPTIK